MLCNGLPCVTYRCGAEDYEEVDPWGSIAFPDARDVMPTNEAGSLAQSPKRSFKDGGATHLHSRGSQVCLPTSLLTAWTMLHADVLQLLKPQGSRLAALYAIQAWDHVLGSLAGSRIAPCQTNASRDISRISEQVHLKSNILLPPVSPWSLRRQSLAGGSCFAFEPGKFSDFFRCQELPLSEPSAGGFYLKTVWQSYSNSQISSADSEAHAARWTPSSGSSISSMKRCTGKRA